MSPLENPGRIVKNRSRLDKFLTLCQLGSRREVLRLIKEGRVFVNDRPVRDPGYRVDPERDRVSFEGRLLIPKYAFYYKFYKPKDIITSTRDREETVIDLLPKDLPGRGDLFPAGRLDKDAEGLILLTTDGELAHRTTHPKWKLPKVYEILLDSPLSEEAKKSAEEGVELKEGKTAPAKIQFLNSERTLLKVEVTEGRHHLLKRLFGKLGYRVLNIKRIAIGPVKLEDLREGEVRPLTEEEVSALKRLLRLG